jgi:hypothetical protein
MRNPEILGASSVFDFLPWQGVLFSTWWDTVCRWHALGQWLSPDTPFSSEVLWFQLHNGNVKYISNKQTLLYPKICCKSKYRNIYRYLTFLYIWYDIPERVVLYLDRRLLLTRKLLIQGFLMVKMRSSLPTFYGRHGWFQLHNGNCPIHSEQTNSIIYAGWFMVSNAT